MASAQRLPRHRQLRARVLTANGIDFDEAVRRATEATQAFAAFHGDVVGGQLVLMHAFVDTDEKAHDWDGLRFMAHDLKGFAGTLGYGFVGDICASLCRLIDTADDRGPRFVALVKSHMEAADFLARNRDDSEAARALLAELEIGCTHVIAGAPTSS